MFNLLIVSDLLWRCVSSENQRMDSTQVISGGSRHSTGLVAVAPKLGNRKCSQAEGLLQQAMLRKMQLQNVLCGTWGLDGISMYMYYYVLIFSIILKN